MSTRRTLLASSAVAAAAILALSSAAPARKEVPIPPAPPALDGEWEVSLTASVSSCGKPSRGDTRHETWKITKKGSTWTIDVAKRKPARRGGSAAPAKLTGRSGRGQSIDLAAGRRAAGQLHRVGDTLSGTLVEVRGGKRACAVVFSLYGNKPSPAVQATGPLPKIGVPECDAYMEKMFACLDKMPGNGGEAAKKALRQSLAQWKKIPASAKPQMAQACQQAMEAAKDAYKQMGCDF